MSRQTFNSFVIEGRLGKDAELKTVGQQNMPMVSFSIAANMARNGSQQDIVVWYNCSMFRNTKIVEYLKKGTRVLINGQLEFNKSQDGATTYYGILVNGIELLAQAQTAQQSVQTAQPQAAAGFNGNDPFSSI